MNFKLKRNMPKYNFKFKLFIAVVIIAGILLSIFSYNRIVTDRVRESVMREAKEKTVVMIKESTREFLETHKNFAEACFTQTDKTKNKSSSYAINTELINLAENEIITLLKEKLEQTSVISIKIPVGSLMNNQFFSGKGFPVNIKVYMSTSISSSVSSNIESAGINQSLYKIMLKIDVEGELIFPKGSEKFNVSSTVPLGEKIIMGSVPLS